MKIRQTIKKAIALGTGALMLGATVLGASAANLSDYPGLFLKDGKISAKLVVGEKAATVDVLGAIDIAADLQANAVSKEAVTVAGTGISVTGGKTKEVDLGSDLSGFTSLDDSDIASLKDEKISWNDEDLDIEETLLIDGVKIFTSEDDEDFGADFFLGTDTADAIQYRYTINDNDFDKTLVGEGTNEDVLKLEILGRSLEIQSVGTDNSSVTMTVAQEYYMNIGDSVEVEGKTIKLVNVGQGSIVVDVEGDVQTVGDGNTEKVGGIKVQVETGSIFYVDEKEDRAVTLTIGDQITETINDGDSMEIFGEPDKENDAEWVWVISTTADDELIIGADFNQFYDSDTEPVKGLGEKFMLPNNYASIYMDSVTAVADVDVDIYFEQGISVDTWEDGTDVVAGTLENLNALILEASDDVFEVAVNGTSDVIEETNTVYLIANGTTDVWAAYKNSDDDIQLFVVNGNSTNSEDFDINYEDTDIVISYDASNSSAAALNFSGSSLISSGTAYFVLDADIPTKAFGAEGDAQGPDLATSWVKGPTGATDTDYLTTWGIKINAPEDDLDNDEFSFTIPSEQVQVNVVALGSGGAVEGEAGSVTTDKVNPVGVDFGVLDSDAPAAGTTNLIVVGGPCANTEAARLLGNPANCAEGFSAGEAKLALFDDDGKVALLVAGYSAQDTLGAVRALITEVLPAKSDAKVITTNYKTPSIE